MVTVLLQGNVKLYFELFFTAFLMVVGRGGRGGVCGRVLQIGGSCFVWQKCNCGRLRATAWVFVDVKQKLETLVLNVLLIAVLRHYSPSLRRVSYPAPQSSVSAVGTTFVSSMKDSHQSVDRSIIFVTH
jgi:hypothetical protein